jgi:hypothetical protein
MTDHRRKKYQSQHSTERTLEWLRSIARGRDICLEAFSRQSINSVHDIFTGDKTNIWRTNNLAY